MMHSGPSAKGLIMKRKVLSAAAKLFLEYGYEGTSSRMVADLLGVSSGSPFYQYGNKEGVLLEFTRRMFSNQFNVAESIAGASADPLHIYAAETCLQLHIAEQSEQLRELYVMAYTLPSTSMFIHQGMLPKIAALFGEFLPNRDEGTLFGLELAASGTMRNFMVWPCTETFPMELKLGQFLGSSFRVYGVPPERFRPIVAQMVQVDLADLARHIIEETVRTADEEFEAAMEMKFEPKRYRTRARETTEKE